MPMRMLRVTAVAPKVLASTLLAVMALALLPFFVGLAVFLVWLMVLALLASGPLEESMLRAFRGARAPGDIERAVVAPVLARLAAANIFVTDLSIDHNPRRAQPAIVLGRRSLIVSRRLVEATYRKQLSRNEAAGLIAHAIGRHHARRHRFELALQGLTFPCIGVLAVAGRVRPIATWFPLIRLACQLRLVIAVICVVQSAAEGRTVYGLITGAFIALTYLGPAANRTIERRVEYAADTYLIDHGFGTVFADARRRIGRPVPLERLQRLTTGAHLSADTSVPERPMLQLVHGTTSTPTESR